MDWNGWAPSKQEAAEHPQDPRVIPSLFSRGHWHCWQKCHHSPWAATSTQELGPWLHQWLFIVLLSLTSTHSPCSSTQGSYSGSDWATELWFELCCRTLVGCSLALHFPGNESHWSRVQCTDWLLSWLWMCLAASSPWILQWSEFSAEPGCFLWPALLGHCGWLVSQSLQVCWAPWMHRFQCSSRIS